MYGGVGWGRWRSSPSWAWVVEQQVVKKKRERALVVIDMTTRLVYGEGGPAVAGARDLIRFIQGELRYFRERDRAVVFVLSRGRAGSTIIPELTPRAGELIVDKPSHSCFFGTRLEEYLRERGAGRVTFVGIGTADNILISAADADARGFGVSVPDPCVIDIDDDAHAFALKLIRDRIAPIPGGEDVTSPSARIVLPR
jgi:nicotinamidase-related amidase